MAGVYSLDQYENMSQGWRMRKDQRCNKSWSYGKPCLRGLMCGFYHLDAEKGMPRAGEQWKKPICGEYMLGKLGRARTGCRIGEDSCNFYHCVPEELEEHFAWIVSQGHWGNRVPRGFGSEGRGEPERGASRKGKGKVGGGHAYDPEVDGRWPEDYVSVTNQKGEKCGKGEAPDQSTRKGQDAGKEKGDSKGEGSWEGKGRTGKDAGKDDQEGKSGGHGATKANPVEEKAPRTETDGSTPKAAPKKKDQVTARDTMQPRSGSLGPVMSEPREKDPVLDAYFGALDSYRVGLAHTLPSITPIVRRSVAKKGTHAWEMEEAWFQEHEKAAEAERIAKTSLSTSERESNVEDGLGFCNAKKLKS